jgi:dynein heavy chain, axonemal
MSCCRQPSHDTGADSLLACLRSDAVSKAKKRYDVGLEKLEFATQQVNTMQKELEDLQPVLAQSQVATNQLMEVIQSKLPGVEVIRAQVSKEAAAAQAEADKCQAQKDEVEADLAEAMPVLNEVGLWMASPPAQHSAEPSCHLLPWQAIKALDTIKPTEINEVRALAKPPIGTSHYWLARLFTCMDLTGGCESQV